MADRCAESWRLSDELTRQSINAVMEGYLVNEYPPFRAAHAKIQAHFKSCPDCRAWVDETAAVGNRKPLERAGS